MSVAMIFAFIIMVLAPVILMITGTVAKNATNHNKKVIAYYNARSGIDYAAQIIEGDLCDLLMGEPLYFYGSLETGLTLVKNNYPEDHVNEEIFVEVKWEDGGGELIAIGRNKDVKETLVREFTMGGTGEITEYILFYYEDYPDISHIGEDTEGVPVKWLPVTFTGDEYFYEFPVMYFTGICLVEHDCKNISLTGNFIYFGGDIIFKYPEGDPWGSICLRTLDTQITGDVLGHNYGLVYFKGDILLECGDDKSLLKSLGPGFYYFPDNLDLFAIDARMGGITVIYGLNNLIPVDFNQIDFGGLNIISSLNTKEIRPAFGLYR